MGIVSVTAWRCDFPSCGHVWYSDKEPQRCAKCKRKNWNKVKGDVVRAPKIRKRKPKAAPAVTTNAGREEVLILRTADPLDDKPAAEPEGPSYSDVTATVFESVVASVPDSEPVLPTIVRQPTAAKYREILKNLAEHKIGEKCPHGWANWLQCDKCNPKVNQ